MEASEKKCPACKKGTLVQANRRTARPREFNGSDQDMFWFCPGCGWSEPIEEDTDDGLVGGIVH
jgi:uncharacterized protein with PIN domain